MWQQKTFERFSGLLGEAPSVREIVLLGSLADGQHVDQWSDLDIGVVVEESAFGRFFPGIDWIKPLGDVYAINQSAGDRKGTSRIVFADGSRVDFSITTNKALLSTEAPRFNELEQAKSLQNLTNDFKFEAFLAIAKLARNDLLIGLHLILELERKCLVVGMMLRDKQTGTTHHRHGGPFNEVVEQLSSFKSSKSEPLNRLESSIDLFDGLAKQLDPKITLDWKPLRGFVEEARLVKPER